MGWPHPPTKEGTCDERDYLFSRAEEQASQIFECLIGVLSGAFHFSNVIVSTTALS